MAFLDNSGDIILDAVLTDAGRQRMARGNFKIVKFALGDEEINYVLYNSSHPSGSAFYDLDVMQTPIMEALTNNTATMKSKLLTIARTNILHMPILKVNEVLGGENTKSNLATDAANAGMFVIASSTDTETTLGGEKSGIIFGVGNSAQRGSVIVVDQGQDTAGDPPVTEPMDSDLIETQYIVQIDHRLGRIAASDNAVMPFSFVDDDNIATYYFGLNVDAVVSSIGFPAVAPDNQDIDTYRKTQHSFTGPTGSRLTFKIKASPQIRQSSALLTKLGGTSTISVPGTEASATCYYTDTNVRVTGVTTGYTIDIPVRFARKV
jgi:hypothetical protein